MPNLPRNLLIHHFPVQMDVGAGAGGSAGEGPKRNGPTCAMEKCTLPDAPGQPHCMTHLTTGPSVPVPQSTQAVATSSDEQERQKCMAALQAAADAMPSLATTQQQLNPQHCDSVVDKYRQSFSIATQIFIQANKSPVQLPIGMQQALLSGDGDTTIKTDGKAPQRLDQGMRLILFTALLQHCLAINIPALAKPCMDAIVEFRFHQVFVGVVLQQRV